MCVCVSVYKQCEGTRVLVLPNLILVRWQVSQITSHIRTCRVSGKTVHVKLLLYTVRTLQSSIGSAVLPYMIKAEICDRPCNICVSFNQLFYSKLQPLILGSPTSKMLV